MKKVILLVALSLVLSCLPIQAAGNFAIINTGAPGVYFYPAEFDRLVMDFTVARADGGAGILRALTFVNDGTARNFYEISKVVVWADAGPAGFQGMEIDEKLGEAVRTELFGYWYLSELSKVVPQTGLRLFVSIETASRAAIKAQKTVRMRVPAATDGEIIGQFDLGDSGLFLEGIAGPSENIQNPNIQTIIPSSTDVSAPKTLIIDPKDGSNIAETNYKIIGVSRDQGGSTPASVQILINSGSSEGSWTEVENTGINFSTWEYTWTDISDGTYTIKTRGSDWLGNTEVPGEGVVVTIDQTAMTAVSPALSTVSSGVATVAANGVDRAIVTVTVKNSTGNPLSGKTVVLSSSRPTDSITASKNLTGADGLATFTVKSTLSGDATLKATVGTVEIVEQPVVTFTAVTFAAGDLIKGAGSTAVYYYGENGRRYIFPTMAIYSSWFSDFSSIKTISDAELASVPTIGNVTVRPGKLVQIVSMDTPWRVMDPKVYAVSKGGVLHWVTTDALAEAIWGVAWEGQIVAVPEALLTNYTIGTEITVVSDYSLSAEQAVADVNEDKDLQ